MHLRMQRVERHHALTCRDESRCEGRANEAGASGNEDRLRCHGEVPSPTISSTTFGNCSRASHVPKISASARARPRYERLPSTSDTDRTTSSAGVYGGCAIAAPCRARIMLVRYWSSLLHRPTTGVPSLSAWYAVALPPLLSTTSARAHASLPGRRSATRTFALDPSMPARPAVATSTVTSSAASCCTTCGKRDVSPVEPIET